jgi:uncharacterized protein (TIGR02145 family)
MKTTIILSVIATTLLFSCLTDPNKSSNNNATYSSQNQSDSIDLVNKLSELRKSTEPPKVIKEVKIGTQIWAAEDLDVVTFRNGDPIPEIKSDRDDWHNAGINGTPAYCYNNKYLWMVIKREIKHGMLYNWYAVSDPRGLAPEGWHVPSIDEWKILINFLGGEDEAFNKMTAYIKEINSDTINSSGFGAMPGGERNFDVGNLWEFGRSTNYWSASRYENIDNRQGMPPFYPAQYLRFRTPFSFSGTHPGNGFSVRCIKD